MERLRKPKIIIVVGATASGKSGLAVELALKFNGEVISADSRQVYRKLDIGTAKITPKEMKGVPHHLIDIVDIETSYTAADFKRDAAEKITEIIARGNTPIITGGTFFYIDMLLNRISAPQVEPNPALREKLEQKDTSTLFKELQEVDPDRAARIDPSNPRRLVRALEIVQSLGFVPKANGAPSPYDVLLLGLISSKEDLRAQFAQRARTWLAKGFIQEVQELLHSGVRVQRLSEMGFEYQLGMELLNGTLNETAFIEKFVQKNWQYAKRQLTWLKRDRSVRWVYLSEKQEIDLVVQQFLLH